MTRLAWACALCVGVSAAVAAEPAAQPAWVLDDAALRVDTLFPANAAPVRVALVVLVQSTLEDAPATAAQVTLALQHALRSSGRVGDVVEVQDTTALVGLDDVRVAKNVSALMQVQRVVLARVLRNLPPAAPKLVLGVLTAQGHLEVRLEPEGVWVEPPSPLPPVTHMETPLTQPGPQPPAAPLLPPPESLGPEQPAASKVDLFKAQALTLRVVNVRDGVTPPSLVMERDGVALGPAELKALGAPPPLPRGAPQGPWVGDAQRALVAALLPATWIGAGCGGWLGLMLGGALMVAWQLAQSGFNVSGPWVLGVVVVPACGGMCGGMGAVLGLPLSAAAVWRWWMISPPVDPPPTAHPWVAFVTRYNKRLARRLGVSQRQVGHKYFPGVDF